MLDKSKLRLIVEKKFPHIKLSYDNLLHRKVYTDCYMAIPQGKKSLIWFTYYNGKNVSIMLYLDKYNIIDYETIIVQFNSDLSLGKYGTIISGIQFRKDGMNYFSCDNILYFKGNDMSNKNYKNKFSILKELFGNINQTNHFKHYMLLGMPVIKRSFQEIYNNIENIPYKIYSIKCINLHKRYSEGIVRVKKIIEKHAYFKVKADIQPDIYYLYISNANNSYNIASIPDYKTSVMMNKIFRKIKENDNLDLLEESEDEDEFEDISEDKYVIAEKCVIMKCVYLKRFNKWQPISIAKQNPSTYNEIKYIERM